MKTKESESTDIIRRLIRVDTKVVHKCHGEQCMRWVSGIAVLATERT